MPSMSGYDPGVSGTSSPPSEAALVRRGRARLMSSCCWSDLCLGSLCRPWENELWLLKLLLGRFSFSE